MSEQLDTDESKRLKLITAGLAVVLLVIVSVVFLALRGGDDGEQVKDFTLSSKDQAAAASFTKDFFKVAGNYGLSEAVFGDVRSSFLTDSTQDNENFVSRSSATDELAASYFARGASYETYELYQEPIGTPYRVTTTIGDPKVPTDGFILDGHPAVQFDVDVTSVLSYYGRGQGYLLDDGTPAPVKTVRAILTYKDTATLQLVQNGAGRWTVNRVQGLDKISILAFQSPINFHDDIVVDMPDPVSEDRTDVEGAPPL